MALNVISNFAANVAHRNLMQSDAAAGSSLTKLSSGQRVVSAKDDAASLAIGSRLRAEVVAMKTASVNAGQAGSMLQIADGAMATISDILVRMKELAVQASSGQFSSVERSILDTEFQALSTEITRISNDTEFNGTQLIAGAGDVVTQQVGQTAQFAAEGVSITYDTNVATNGDAYRISYANATEALTVTNINSGESTTVDVTAAVDAVVVSRQPTAGATGTDLVAGETVDVQFASLGLTVTLSGGATPGTDGFDRTGGGDLGTTGAVAVTAGGLTGTGNVAFANATSSVTNAGLTALLASSAFDASTGLLTVTMNNTSADVATFQAAGIDLGAGVGTASADVDVNIAQVDTVTIGGTFEATDIFQVNVNGTDYTLTVTGGHTDNDGIATALAALVNANGAVGATATGAVITITAAAEGTAFFTSVLTQENGNIPAVGQTIALATGGGGASVANATAADPTLSLVAGGETLGTVTVGTIEADGAANGSFTIDLGNMLFGQSIVAGGSNSSFNFKVGTGNQSYDTLAFTVNAASASALGVLGTSQSGLVGITTAGLAETASTAVSTAIDTLNTSRSNVGAAQNRLTFAAQNLASAIENAEAARSTLLDLDVAAEITVFTSKQILVQTGVAMLAQANQMPQNLLRLFQ